MVENKISEKEKFNFERKGIDFPFYNNNPFLSNTQWIILAVGFLVTIIFALIPKPQFPQIISEIIYFLIPFATFAYVAKGKFGLICKKFKKSDVKLIFGTLILYFIYTFVIGTILKVTGFVAHSNPALSQLGNITFWIGFPLQIFGEELIKLIPFLIVLFLVYKFTNKRKIGIILGTTVSLFVFGLIHYNAYGNILSVILIQGIGSIFMFFAYLKSKNILTSYIVHLLTDTLVFLLTMSMGTSFLFL